MNEETKNTIREKLKAIYTLTDEILGEVNSPGNIRFRYPYGYDQEEMEAAILEYVESRISKHTL